MGIKTKQISQYIVKPVLEALGLIGHNFTLGIGAQESLMGTYIHQVNGPALGLWQPEPTTHDDVWRYLLRKFDPHKTVDKKVKWLSYLSNKTIYIHEGGCCVYDSPLYEEWRQGKLYKQYHDRLIYDLRYCCAIARLKLYMIPEPLPAEDDIVGMAHYWKKYYNSSKGKGDVDDFITNYYKYVVPYV